MVEATRRVEAAEYVLSQRFPFLRPARGWLSGVGTWGLWYDPALVDAPEFHAALQDPDAWGRLWSRYWRFAIRKPEVRLGGPLPPMVVPPVFPGGDPSRLSRRETWQPSMLVVPILEQFDLSPRGHQSNRATFMQAVMRAADKAWEQLKVLRPQSPYAPLWEVLHGKYAAHALDWWRAYLDGQTFEQIAKAEGIDERTVSKIVNLISQVLHGERAEDYRHGLKPEAGEYTCTLTGHGNGRDCPADCPTWRSQELGLPTDQEGMLPGEVGEDGGSRRLQRESVAPRPGQQSYLERKVHEAQTMGLGHYTGTLPDDCQPDVEEQPQDDRRLRAAEALRDFTRGAERLAGFDGLPGYREILHEIREHPKKTPQTIARETRVSVKVVERVLEGRAALRGPFAPETADAVEEALIRG